MKTQTTEEVADALQYTVINHLKRVYVANVSSDPHADPLKLSEVIERVMDAMRRYRDEDPEPYRALIEKHTQRRMQQMEEGYPSTSD